MIFFGNKWDLGKCGLFAELAVTCWFRNFILLAELAVWLRVGVLLQLAFVCHVCGIAELWRVA